MTDKTLSWVALLTLMVEGVDRPIRGTIRSLNPETHFAFAGFGNQGPPVLPAAVGMPTRHQYYGSGGMASGSGSRSPMVGSS